MSCSWYSRWGGSLSSVVGYAVIAALLLPGPAVLIAVLLWLSTGPVAELSREPSPPARTACPSSEAIQAVTGFPKNILDGPLSAVERQRLAGTWVTARQEYPRLLISKPSELIQVQALAFDGDRCKITYAPKQGEFAQELALAVEFTANCCPRGFDLIGTEGDIAFRCIYEATEDRLTIKLGLDRLARPTWDESLLDAALVLVLKRE